MKGSFLYFFMDDLMPTSGRGGCSGDNGYGCMVCVVFVVLYLFMSLIQMCQSTVQTRREERRERKEVEQQRQRLQDFNDSLSTAYFWDFAKQRLEAEGFTGLTLHDTYVTGTYESFLKIVLPSGKNEYLDSPPQGYDLAGNFHIEGDTTLFFYDMRMFYDYKNDEAHELQPECSETNVYIRSYGYMDKILWRLSPETVFIDAPYDSILEARKSRLPHPWQEPPIEE